MRARTGLLVPSGEDDRRFVFVIPWEDRYYAGTTDTAYQGDLESPAVEQADVDYVLGAVARSFPDVNERCVVASWAGLRPLARGGDGPTADLSRRHQIYEEPAGLVTVTGGKLTTYRAMAEDVVDRIAPRTKSRTPALPLGLTMPLTEALARSARAAAAVGLSEDEGRRFVHRYGDDWQAAVALIRRTAGARGAGRRRRARARSRPRARANTRDGADRRRRERAAAAADDARSHGSSAPGLRIPFGSSARLTRRSSSSPPAPSSRSRNRAFSRPTPWWCVSVPPVSWQAATASSQAAR